MKGITQMLRLGILGPADSLSRDWPYSESRRAARLRSWGSRRVAARGCPGAPRHASARRRGAHRRFRAGCPPGGLRSGGGIAQDRVDHWGASHPEEAEASGRNARAWQGGRGSAVQIGRRGLLALAASGRVLAAARGGGGRLVLLPLQA